jgi:hypothetical protein
MNTVVNITSSANTGIYMIARYLKSFVYPTTKKERMLTKTDGTSSDDVTSNNAFTSSSIANILDGYKKMQSRYTANKIILLAEENALEQVSKVISELKAINSVGGSDDYITDWVDALTERETQILSNRTLLKENQELYEQYKGDLKSKKSEPMSDDDFWQCTICQENRKNRAFGCGHVFCDICTERLNVCPICKTRVDPRKTINIFL